MPFPLNKAPRGLIELLRLRTLGKNPQFFEESARAVVDATEYYGADLIVASNLASGAGVMSRVVTDVYTVPGRVHAVGGLVNVGAAAGTQIRLRLEVFPVGGAGVPIGESVITAPVAGAVYQVSGRFPKPFVALPGFSFSLNCSGDAAGADHQLFIRTLFEQYTGTP